MTSSAAGGTPSGPAISVVIPVHNGESFLDEALNSVAAQTFRDIEVLIVDDRSTDRTRAIANAFCKREQRARVLDSRGPGVAHARNTGIDFTRAPWVAILDHDDVWQPDKLAIQHKFVLANPGVVGLGTWAYYIGTRGRVSGLYRIGATSIEASRTWRQQGHTPYLLVSSALLHREAVLRCGGFAPEFDSAADIVMWDRLADLGDVVSIPIPLASYRVHSTSMSSSRISFQRRISRFLAHNLCARNEKRKELTLAEFERLPSESDFFARMRHWREELGAAAYRNAGGHIADGHWLRGGTALLRAAFFSPAYVLGKLRTQRFR